MWFAYSGGPSRSGSAGMVLGFSVALQASLLVKDGVDGHHTDEKSSTFYAMSNLLKIRVVLRRGVAQIEKVVAQRYQNAAPHPHPQRTAIDPMHGIGCGTVSITYPPPDVTSLHSMLGAARLKNAIAGVSSDAGEKIDSTYVSEKIGFLTAVKSGSYRGIS